MLYFKKMIDANIMPNNIIIFKDITKVCVDYIGVDNYIRFVDVNNTRDNIEIKLQNFIETTFTYEFDVFDYTFNDYQNGIAILPEGSFIVEFYNAIVGIWFRDIGKITIKDENIYF